MTNRALIIGVSDYASGISSLPGVKFDIAEIKTLLGSTSGAFVNGEIQLLADRDATRSAIHDGLKTVFDDARADDTLFVYIAGHGALQGADYFFVAHDSRLSHLATTAIPLDEIKAMFDASNSERVLLWLDFCHSGGILARGVDQEDQATAAIARALHVTQGEGKVIMCACTASQLAYESVNHGHFTKCLLEGLRGAAANAAGEVTANSLHDYIDAQMGSAQQRPMFFGKQTGRIVLMHSRSASPPPKPPSTVNAEQFVVSESGQWVMIGDLIVEADSVKQSTDGGVTLVIPSTGSGTDARIRALKPEQQWNMRSVGFAHRNDGFLARVTGIESESSAAGAAWTVKIMPTATQCGGGFLHDFGLQADGQSYSGDEIAEMRARRLLLGETLNRRKGTRDASSMLDHFIEGMGTAFPVTEAIFTRFADEIRSDPKVGMRKARLAAIYALKASQVFEQVIELRLGPISNGKLRVACEGKRREQYVNRGPTVFRIEGDYVLP